jgi:glycosyltransferase involved in cell wall biosynthesis
MLLSIVIPTYNSSLTVERCLASILKQTFTDYEVVVIDGKSKDHTVEIVQMIQTKANKVTVISEKDYGIYDAMNKGIKIARGEWLYFLGSDDMLYNEFVLEDVFGAQHVNHLDVIYGSVYNTHLQKVYDGEFNNEKICKEGICHQSIFYRRELFFKFGLYDHEMKVYAHVWMDKILFTDETVRWKYIDVIIATYDGSGMSSTTMDYKYWRHAETLLNKCFKKKLPDAVIYSSLLPIPRWIFSAFSFSIALKIAIKGGTFAGLKYWFNHPYQIGRQTIKKYFKKAKSHLAVPK